MAYLSPNTVDNQELRQCLSYFFPVYCYSLPANQRRMREVQFFCTALLFNADWYLVKIDLHQHV